MSEDNFWKNYSRELGLACGVLLSLTTGMCIVGKIIGALEDKQEMNSIKPALIQEYYQQKTRIDSTYHVEASAFAKHKSQLEHSLDSSNASIKSKYESKLDSLRNVYRK